jgi:flagellar biogenesis protein FliO
MKAVVALNLYWLGCSATLASSVAQPIPFKQEVASGGGELLRVMGGLALCVLVLAGVLVFLRRRTGFNLTGSAGATGASAAAGNARLRIVDRLRLGARSSLVVVEYEGKRHVLAQSEHGIALITTLSGPSIGEGSRGR